MNTLILLAFLGMVVYATASPFVAYAGTSDITGSVAAAQGRFAAEQRRDGSGYGWSPILPRIRSHKLLGEQNSTPISHPSFQFVKAGGNLTIFQGRDFKILNFLATNMNFNYQIVTPPDGKWGTCDDNGHCVGLIEMLAKKEADMGISSINPTASRARFVDFSYPYMLDEVSFTTKEPDTKKTAHRLFFVHAMKIEVWIFLASFLSISYLINKTFNWKFLKEDALTLSTMMGILLKQGVGDMKLRSMKNKSWTLVTFISIVVSSGCLCKIYECSITSTTSFAPSSTPIDTIEDLVDAVTNRNYIVMALDSSSVQKTIMTAKSGYFSVFAKSTSLKAPQSVDDILEPFLKGDMAFACEKLVTQKAIAMNKWPSNMFHWSRESLYVTFISIAFRKDFPCKDQVNKWLRILTSMDLINKWDVDDVRLPTKQRLSISDHLSYITYEDLAFVLSLLPVGWLIAIITLTLEFYIFYTAQK